MPERALFPASYVVAVQGTGRSRPRKPRPCPHCGVPGGLCEEHRARLAVIQEELKSRSAWVRSTIPGTAGAEYEFEEAV